MASFSGGNQQNGNESEVNLSEMSDSDLLDSETQGKKFTFTLGALLIQLFSTVGSFKKGFK